MTEHVRFNIDIINDTDSPAPCEYYESRSAPLLKKPSDYYMTIERFTIPTSDIPIMISQIKTGQSNVNLTNWKVQIVYNTNVYEAPIYHIPCVDASLTPRAPLVKQDLSTRYYFITSYVQFVLMINNALTAAWADMFDAESPTQTVIAPRMTYKDGKLSLIALVAYTVEEQASIGTYTTDIRMSKSLMDIIGNLPRIERTDDFYSVIVRYIKENLYNDPDSAPTVPPIYVKIDQEFNSAGAFSTMRKIVFTTNSLPIVQEYINSTKGDILGKMILTDFTPPIQNVGDQQTIMYYTPAGPYRMLDINRDTDLSTIDLKAYWQDKLGNLFPLMLPTRNSASIKLLFVKKTSNYF